MLKTTSNPVGWFEIPVLDMKRAMTFYGAVFQVELTLMEMGPMKMGWFPMGQPNDPPKYGAAGTLVEREGAIPAKTGTLIYFEVVAIDPVLELIEKSGGKVVGPRTDISPYGFMGHFEDTEGNLVALHEMPDGAGC